MWLAVDRIEEDLVVLMDDDEVIYHLTQEAYTALCGRAPRENTMLDAEIKDGRILSAVCSDEEETRRLAEVKARLARLVNRRKS